MSKIKTLTKIYIEYVYIYVTTSLTGGERRVRRSYYLCYWRGAAGKEELLLMLLGGAAGKGEETAVELGAVYTYEAHNHSTLSTPLSLPWHRPCVHNNL